MPTTPQDMPGTEIARRLFEIGRTQAGIARILGVAPFTVGRVLHGYGSSERIERAIAEAIGLPWEKVFAGRAYKRAQRFAVNG